MTENPAASTNEAADLLKAVRGARSSTGLILNARMPELTVLVGAAFAAYALDGASRSGRDVLATLALAVGLVLSLLFFQYRRRNLGGTTDRAVWIVGVLVFASGLGSSHLVHGDAKETAIGVCFTAGAFGLAALCRSWVLVVVGSLLAVGSVVLRGHSAFVEVVSYALGLGVVVFVRLAGRRAATRKV